MIIQINKFLPISNRYPPLQEREKISDAIPGIFATFLYFSEVVKPYSGTIEEFLKLLKKRIDDNSFAVFLQKDDIPFGGCVWSNNDKHQCFEYVFAGQEVEYEIAKIIKDNLFDASDNTIRRFGSVL